MSENKIQTHMEPTYWVLMHKLLDRWRKQPYIIVTNLNNTKFDGVASIDDIAMINEYFNSAYYKFGS